MLRLLTHVGFRLRLYGAIYRPDSFVLMLRYCANLKAIRYESTSLNRIVAVKSHRVIVALGQVVDSCRIFSKTGSDSFRSVLIYGKEQES